MGIASIFSQPDGNVLAEMTFQGKTYSIADFSTSFSQNIDMKGEPQGEVHGAILAVTLHIIPDKALIQWAANKWGLKSGEIVFKNETGTAPLKISFTDAACIKLSQYTEVGFGVRTQIVISPKEVSFNDVPLSNGWRE
ncbi:MAG: hypothetical protein J6S89_08460 [Paludibacteraceae bacterium]|nr:hypothetical protein [Paludibacteraceae bacterium]